MTTEKIATPSGTAETVDDDATATDILNATDVDNIAGTATAWTTLTVTADDIATTSTEIIIKTAGSATDDLTFRKRRK